MKNIIYPKAGKIILVKYNSDGTLGVTGSSLIGNTGVVSKIESKIEIKTTELPDGNSDWPMGIYDTGTDGSIMVELSNFNPKLYAALTGATFNDAMTSAQMWSADEEHTIPSSGPYTVTLGQTPATSGSIVIVNEESSPFVKVSSNPSVGQFSVSGDAATFNVSDAGKGIFATYDWTASTASNLALPTSANRPVYQAIIETEATDKDQIKTYKANIVVDKCKGDGSIAPPPQQRQASPWSFNLKVLKPRNGYNPVYLRYAATN